MKRNIDLLIQTPFETYIKKSVVFNEESKIIHILDDNDLNGKEVLLNIGTTFREDIERISADVEKRKVSNLEKYASYDTNDIVLESIKIKDHTAVCNYTINAGSYRRICVGVLSNIYMDKSNQYFLFPPMYNGEVCW